MVEKYSNVLIRKVNIVSWESDAATQAGREFKLEGIPYVRVYGTRGDLLGEIGGGDIDAIEAAVRKEAK